VTRDAVRLDRKFEGMNGRFRPTAALVMPHQAGGNAAAMRDLSAACCTCSIIGIFQTQQSWSVGKETLALRQWKMPLKQEADIQLWSLTGHVSAKEGCVSGTVISN